MADKLRLSFFCLNCGKIVYNVKEFVSYGNSERGKSNEVFD